MDKLEAIPGFRTTLTMEEFVDVVNRTGLSIVGQSGNLAPADKKMYALRDVTATVDSIPLIAVSIMGKKLAAGDDCILLDVKTGSGAFMKTLEGSVELAKTMVSIGGAAGKKTAALITNMDIPLGNYIGNALEVAEAVEVLKGGGPSDLREVCLHLAANMLELADKGDFAECMETAQKTLEDGSAFSKFLEMAEAQGGDISCIRDTSRLPFAPLRYEVRARKEGYIAHMDTQACGTASVLLGAGRETKESLLDYGAGIILKKKTGDYVKEGDVLAEFLASEEKLFPAAEEKFHSALTIAAERPEKEKLILGKVSANCTEIF